MLPFLVLRVNGHDRYDSRLASKGVTPGTFLSGVRGTPIQLSFRYSTADWQLFNRLPLSHGHLVRFTDYDTIRAALVEFGGGLVE